MHFTNLKLARAVDQLQAMDREIAAWLAANPMVAKGEKREARLGFRLVQQPFANPVPLEHWGLLVGEYVHNVRSSLDNLAFALACVHKDPPEKPKSISFPILTDKAEFEQKGRKAIAQLPPAAVDLIERLQPFQRDGSSQLGSPENDALVSLHSLSNADKHRVPSVVLIAPTEISHSCSVRFLSEADAAANEPPDVIVHGGPLSPGVVLLEYRTKHPIAEATGKFEGKAIVALQKDTGPVPLIVELRNLGYYAALVAAQFRPWFAPVPGPPATPGPAGGPQ